MRTEAGYDLGMNRGVCFYCGKALRKVRRQDAKYCDSTCRMAALRQRRRTQRERRQAVAPAETGQPAGKMTPSSPLMNSALACQTLRTQLLGHREGRPLLHTHPFLQTVADAAACEVALKELNKRLLEIKQHRQPATESWLKEAGALILRDGEPIDIPANVTHVALAPIPTTEGVHVVLVVARKE